MWLALRRTERMTFSVTLLAAAVPAQAQEHGVVFVGGTASNAPSVYVGGVVALPGETLGRGLAARAVLGFNDFWYDGDPGRVKARQKTATLTAVYQWSGDWGYANLAAGGVFRATLLRPDDPNNATRGSQWDGMVGADGARNLGLWRVVGLTSYQIDLREYYARIDATRRLSKSLRLGAEATAQGNPLYDRQLYGVVVAVSPSPRWELRLSGGALVQRRRNSPYSALALSRVF